MKKLRDLPLRQFLVDCVGEVFLIIRRLGGSCVFFCFVEQLRISMREVAVT